MTSNSVFHSAVAHVDARRVVGRHQVLVHEDEDALWLQPVAS